MANSGLGFLAGNFLNAFTQARQNKQLHEDAKVERNAKLKLFELQLKREQQSALQSDQQSASRKQLFDMMGGTAPVQSSTPQDGIGPVPGPKPAMSLTDLLADPKAAALILQSGVGSLKDLTEAQGQSGNQALLKQLMGGGNVDPGMSAPGGANQPGTSGGFEVSGIKLDSSGNPMIDLSRRGEVARWMVGPDGRTQFGVDKMGKVVTTQPAGPSDRAPEDVPLPPSSLADMRTPDGKMLPPGTTLRQAQQLGAATAPKPAESDKQKSLLLDGMKAAESTLSNLRGADSSSITNTSLSKLPGGALLTGQDFRKYEAAKRQWVQNYVFLKSGAQAGPSETKDTMEMFFPLPRDDAATKAQKAAMRSVEMTNMAAKYGNQGTPQGAATLTYDPATGTFK